MGTHEAVKEFKTPEKKREYMRKYMKTRYHEQKAAAGVPSKTHEVAQMEKRSEDTDKTMSAIGNTIDVVKALTGKEDDDPLLKAITKYEKPIMLGLEFLKGFAERMNEHNAQQFQAAQRAQAPQGPIAPPGWQGLSWPQRMSKKWDGQGNVTAWYKAGEAYEEFVETGGTAYNAVSNYPVSMGQTYHGQQQSYEASIAEARARRAGTAVPLAPVNSMRELEAQAHSDMKPQGAAPSHDPGFVAQVQAAQATPKAEEQLKEVAAMMNEDNARYIQMMLTYFKTRSLEQFEKDIENADGTIKNFVKEFGWILPVQTREAIKHITLEEIEKSLKECDPKKHELIEKKKLRPQFAQLWAELQKQV